MSCGKCEFNVKEMTNKGDNVVLQQTSDIVGDKHIQISNNEIDFDNETTCGEELYQQKSSQ